MKGDGNINVIMQDGTPVGLQYKFILKING